MLLLVLVLVEVVFDVANDGNHDNDCYVGNGFVTCAGAYWW